ncbi:MAG: class I SAM-dependent methyltransferase [Chloroflexia bacterium]
MKLEANLALNRAEWAEQSLRKMLPTAPSNVVSDIGCGFAWMEDPVEALGATWQGFDQVPKAAGVRCWDVTHSAPDGAPRPGIVLMLEVLEHLSNPQIALHNIAEHLLPGGYLILTSPNPAWSRSRVYMLRHGVPYSFTPRHLREHHVFTTWPHVVEHLLVSAGFEIVEYVTLAGGITNSGASRALDHMKALAVSVLSRLVELADRSARGYTLGIVARKLHEPEGSRE